MHNRKAKVRIDNFTGPNFNLQCGVPQGGCLSPSLFNYYTHDIPDTPSIFNNNNIYADDITQIISYKSEKFLKKITESEVKKINEYENIWKINTNMNKFQIIPLPGNRKEKIEIDNKQIEYSPSGISLGMKISKAGFNAHTNQRIAIAKSAIPKLYSLIELSPSNKRLLYLTMIRSKLLYPTTPLQTRSTTMIKKMQVVQNRCARIITKTRLTEHQTNSSINQRANLTAINIVLHNNAKSIWNKMNLTEDQQLKMIVNANREKIQYKSSRRLCDSNIEPKFN